MAPVKLSRASILSAALTLVDHHGWEGLSMRRLAQELDVWPMAVYRHFADKEALVAALAEMAAERVVLPSRGTGWRQRVAALGSEARRMVRPGDAGSAAPGGPRLADAAVGALMEAGLDSADALVTWRAVVATAAGYGPSEDGDGFAETLAAILEGVEARVSAPAG